MGSQSPTATASQKAARTLFERVLSLDLMENRQRIGQLRLQRFPDLQELNG
jgi:hypothetical protein